MKRECLSILCASLVFFGLATSVWAAEHAVANKGTSSAPATLLTEIDGNTIPQTDTITITGTNYFGESVLANLYSTSTTDPALISITSGNSTFKSLVFPWQAGTVRAAVKVAVSGNDSLVTVTDGANGLHLNPGNYLEITNGANVFSTTTTTFGVGSNVLLDNGTLRGNNAEFNMVVPSSTVGKPADITLQNGSQITGFGAMKFAASNGQNFTRLNLVGSQNAINMSSFSYTGAANGKNELNYTADASGFSKIEATGAVTLTNTNVTVAPQAGTSLARFTPQTILSGSSLTLSDVTLPTAAIFTVAQDGNTLVASLNTASSVGTRDFSTGAGTIALTGTTDVNGWLGLSNITADNKDDYAVLFSFSGTNNTNWAAFKNYFTNGLGLTVTSLSSNSNNFSEKPGKFQLSGFDVADTTQLMWALEDFNTANSTDIKVSKVEVAPTTIQVSGVGTSTARVNLRNNITAIKSSLFSSDRVIIEGDNYVDFIQTGGANGSILYEYSTPSSTRGEIVFQHGTTRVGGFSTSFAGGSRCYPAVDVLVTGEDATLIIDNQMTESTTYGHLHHHGGNIFRVEDGATLQFTPGSKTNNDNRAIYMYSANNGSLGQRGSMLLLDRGTVDAVGMNVQLGDGNTTTNANWLATLGITNGSTFLADNLLFSGAKIVLTGENRMELASLNVNGTNSALEFNVSGGRFTTLNVANAASIADLKVSASLAADAVGSILPVKSTLLVATTLSGTPNYVSDSYWSLATEGNNVVATLKDSENKGAIDLASGSRALTFSTPSASGWATLVNGNDQDDYLLQLQFSDTGSVLDWGFFTDYLAGMFDQYNTESDMTAKTFTLAGITLGTDDAFLWDFTHYATKNYQLQGFSVMGGNANGVPEPATIWLLLTAVGCFGIVRYWGRIRGA